jgi:type I restriction enzyme S subunit
VCTVWPSKIVKLFPYCLQPNLKVSDVTELIVPIPPEVEQQRIISKVDQLMDICESLKSKIIDAQTTQVQLANAIVVQAVNY